MMRCSSLWAVPLIVTAVAAARAQDATDDRVSNEITNSLGIRLRLIPPGEFQMGCEEPAEVVAGRFADHKLKLSDLDDELPRHRVRITRPFYMRPNRGHVRPVPPLRRGVGIQDRSGNGWAGRMGV